MKKLLVIACLLSTAGAVSAGLKSFRTVYITSMTASGSLGGARASNDTVQYIGCNIYGNEAYNFRSVNCYARDVWGAVATCYSDNPALVDVAGRLNGDSFLYFTYSAANKCMSIRVDNFSYDVPKQP